MAWLRHCFLLSDALYLRRLCPEPVLGHPLCGLHVPCLTLYSAVRWPQIGEALEASGSTGAVPCCGADWGALGLHKIKTQCLLRPWQESVSCEPLNSFETGCRDRSRHVNIICGHKEPQLKVCWSAYLLDSVIPKDRPLYPKTAWLSVKKRMLSGWIYNSAVMSFVSSQPTQQHTAPAGGWWTPDLIGRAN